MLKNNAQQTLVASSRRDHLIGLLDVNRHWFLYQNVRSTAQAVNSDRGMECMRSEHHGDIGLNLGQELAMIGVERAVQLFSTLLSPLDSNIGPGNQLQLRAELFKRAPMHVEYA